MAKQLGIHQIRGKVGERSYYKTKGVEAGISRSINQGLSARVKSAEEFANTRLNNAEFKNANGIATAAFNSVNSRKKGMMRNFAIAAMTKASLEDIKQGTGVWGARVPKTELDTLICDLLEKHAKGGAYDGMFGTISSISLDNTGAFQLSFDLSMQKAAELEALGIDGLVVVPSKCLAGEILVDDLPRLYAGNAIGTPQSISVDSSEDDTFNVEGSVGTPSSVGMSQSGYTYAQEDTKHGFYVCVTFLPYRQQGSARYTMQEYCTFVAVPLGQIPEE